jgi:hypothetical protein
LASGCCYDRAFFVLLRRGGGAAEGGSQRGVAWQRPNFCWRAWHCGSVHPVSSDSMTGLLAAAAANRLMRPAVRVACLALE